MSGAHVIDRPRAAAHARRLGRQPRSPYNGVMNRAVDIDGGQDVAAEAELSELAAMLGKLVEYVWKRATAKRIALRRERLDALRGLISRIALLMVLATQLIVQLIRGTADTAAPVSARAPRHLHHPPQAWAAP